MTERRRWRSKRIQMSDLPPNIPDVEIIAEMGRGTTGVVYQARFVSRDRVVALKTCVPHDRELNQRRLMREGRILAGLTSAEQTGIPKLHVIGEVEGQLYLVRDYIEGATLESVVDRREIGLRSGVRILKRVAEILVRVHDPGLVHRNLQPTNVLLGTDNVIWLIGFGRCRMQDVKAGPGAANTADADIRALQQMLNCMCATLSPDLPDWLGRIRRSCDVASAQEFATVLGACLADSDCSGQ